MGQRSSLILTVERRVERMRYVRPDREHGLPYLDEPSRDVQRLVARYKLLGITVFKRVLAEEEIPEWWLIQVGTTGDRSGWTSKFAAYIN